MAQALSRRILGIAAWGSYIIAEVWGVKELGVQSAK